MDVRFFAATVPGRKGEILDSALAVFADRGYDGGSMREIASRVGITEPALYRHFTGKEDLFTQLIEHTADRLVGEAGDLIAGVRPETLRETLLVAFKDRRLAMRTYFPVLRTILSATSHNPAFLEVYRARLVTPMFERLCALVPVFDARAGEGPRANEDVEARVRAFMSLFVGYLVTSMVFEDDVDEPVVDAMLRLMGWE